MPKFRPLRCPISGESNGQLVFSYDQPPKGEVGFRRAAGEPYYREVWQFAESRHYVGVHGMKIATEYDSNYVDASYKNRDGMIGAYQRVIALPPERSDNAGRMARVKSFADSWFRSEKKIHLLDVGAGLGVFPYAVKKTGWHCTAIDPDARAVDHMNETVGVHAVRGDFMKVEGIGQFDIVTFNKVLEHVEDPINMLRRTSGFLKPGGFVYLELPDGEMAAQDGPGREEFFIEHLHAFSFRSIVMLVEKAGFIPVVVERLQEPSTKYTLRAFIRPA